VLSSIFPAKISQGGSTLWNDDSEIAKASVPLTPENQRGQPCVQRKRKSKFAATCATKSVICKRKHLDCGYSINEIAGVAQALLALHTPRVNGLQRRVGADQIRKRVTTSIINQVT
jgi:hypothetical protein